jgi:uncharacterized cupredoxin-like copper-binding protein
VSNDGPSVLAAVAALAIAACGGSSNKGPLNHSRVAVDSPTVSGPALPAASTPDPASGLAAGRSAAVTFSASKAGVCRIACLVPGHEAAGMWETFRITASGNPGASVAPS